MIAITIAIAGILALSGILLMLDLGPDDEEEDVSYEDVSGAVTGDASMDEESRQRWESYLSSAPTLELSPGDIYVGSEEREVKLSDEIPDGVTKTQNEGERVPSESGADYSDDDALQDDSETESANTGGSGGRTIEEADIVKAVGNKLYVLNSYSGLMVIDLEDPSEPFVEGRAPLMGNPVSMYIVDFLGFVIVSNAPPTEVGSGYGRDGRMYILDLTDGSDPRVVHYVDLEGYPVDSRRVGEVIYVISNGYSFYGYDEGPVREGTDVAYQEDEEEMVPAETTEVVSISFSDPEDMGQEDRVEIPGSSGEVHVSTFALFVPQFEWYWDDGDPETKFTYVDISDPQGDIKVRGTITVEGFLGDRFQMDHYRGMFRVVTQKWPDGGRFSDLPESTLRIIDCRDPDNMKEVGDLLIDDNGNLMATRFAGERAYTIHLPETIDPLDVIDLSVPDDPKLTDILEIPGWVEHMEVIGYKIIAIGVDDTEGDWKVAMSLFDVTDPYEAVLEDRVVIGDGYTYSEANYDEKALTILEEQGLAIIPYSSYDWEDRRGTEYGIQLVSFDLDQGDLDVNGKVEGPYPIQRTREVNGHIVSTSEMVLQTIDHSDPDEPEIAAVLDLVDNVVDSFWADENLVTVTQDPWSGEGTTIRVHDATDPNEMISKTGPSGLVHQRYQREGDTLFISGVRQEGEDGPQSELHRYDVSDPGAVTEDDVVVIDIPDEYLSQNDGGYGYYDDYYVLEDEEAKPGAGEEPSENVKLIAYNDPFTWDVLENGKVAVHLGNLHYGYYYRYPYEEEGEDLEIWVYSWDAEGNLLQPVLYDTQEYDPIVGPLDIMSFRDDVLLISRDWYNSETDVFLLSGEPGNGSMIWTDPVEGDLVGLSEDDRILVTSQYFYDNETYEPGQMLNFYSVDREGVTLLKRMEMDGMTELCMADGMIVSTSTHGRYYGYDVIAYDEEVYDEVAVEKDEGSGGAPSEPEYEEKTTVTLIDLDEEGPSSMTEYTFEGLYYTSKVIDSAVLLQSGFTLTGLDLSNGAGDAEQIGPWTVNGHIRGGELEDGNLAAAFGMWGYKIL